MEDLSLLVFVWVLASTPQVYVNCRKSCACLSRRVDPAVSAVYCLLHNPQ